MLSAIWGGLVFAGGLFFLVWGFDQLVLRPFRRGLPPAPPTGWRLTKQIEGPAPDDPRWEATEVFFRGTYFSCDDVMVSARHGSVTVAGIEVACDYKYVKAIAESLVVRERDRKLLAPRGDDG